jgi:hypothetical protein
MTEKWQPSFQNIEYKHRPQLNGPLVRPNHRALVIPAGDAMPYVLQHSLRNRKQIGRTLFDSRGFYEFDTHYWPLVIGLAVRNPRPDEPVNLVGTAVIKHSVGDKVRVYGDVVLVGWDPLIKDYASVPDDAVRILCSLRATG